MTTVTHTQSRGMETKATSATDEIQSAMGKAKDTLESASGQVKEKVGEAKEQAKEMIAQGRESLDRTLQQGSDEVRKLADNTNAFVRENPGIALAAAAGMGLLVGLAMRNR